MRVAERVAKKDAAVTDQVLERISDARSQSDALFNLLRDDALGSAFYERPIP
ncbi:MAG: hypothetical protein ACLQEI_13905 [Terriglobales bacterium]